ncbi:MAG: HAD family phosphatase [Bacteroidales bacterium]|jgi:putative hydrolase of the HAD superfamily|nr:HAD family phosphatase [Bacteroidales bacterium]
MTQNIDNQLNISTIIFDFGGVLVDLDTSACLAAFNKLGFSLISNLIDHYQQKGLLLDFEEGKISTETFFEKMQELMGNNTPISAIGEAYLAFLRDIPTAKLELLLELKKDYKVLLLSNINAFIWEYSKKRFFETNGHTLSDYFDRCYLSFEMGVCKPNVAIYQQLLEKENLNPQKCLYIDDSQVNIAAGQQFGFQTYYAQKGEDFTEKIREILKNNK